MPDADPKEVFALHRYFLWADQMRESYYSLLASSPTKDAETSTELSFQAPYMSYWYGGMYVVIEGWQELELSDPEIDELLKAPHVDMLRRYRNGSFHFQRRYIDHRFVEFIADPGSAQWIFTLRQAFSRWFLGYLRTPRPTQT